MGYQHWDKLGEEIRDAVDDAVSSGDFSGLGRSIGSLVNGTVEAVRDGIADGLGQNRRAAGHTPYHESGHMPRHESGHAYGAGSTYRNPSVSKQDSPPFMAPALYNKRPKGRALGVVLMACGYSMMAAGLICVLVFAILFAVTDYFFGQIIGFGIMAAAGLMLGIAGNKKYSLVSRFRKYIRQIGGGQKYIAVSDLAQRTGKTISFTMKDLKQMIDQRWFYQAHLDEENGYLILSDKDYREYHQARQDYEKQQKEKARQEEEQRKRQEQKRKEEEKLPEECREVIEAGQNYVRYIRSCNDAIPGEEISAKLDKMERLVERIFEEVRQNPKAASELHKMMDYYLPTTAKLLDTYRELDEQPVSGEHIAGTKGEIEDAIDSLNVAFEKLLDSLFEDKAWDISSDISVLQTMLAQEGLTESDFSVKRTS